MKRGEVCWVEFDPAIDSEISKRRPAIIISNDSANRNLSRVMVIPLTSNISRVYPGEALVKIGNQQSKAMADQMMAADKSRLKTKLGEISKPELAAVEDAIRVHLGLAM
jgi:mRNA interferase MazF